MRSPPPASLPPRISSLPRTSLLPAVLLAVSLGSETAGAASVIQAPTGFQSRTILDFATTSFIGGLALLPDGGMVLYDGASVLLYQRDGSSPLVLFTPDDPEVFGNFLRIAPGGDSLYFGINRPSASAAPHNIYRLPIRPVSPGTAEVVDAIRFNYDLAFDDQGRGFVSSMEIGSENRIFLLDGDPQEQSDAVVVGIPTYSGPLVFHQGKLYYATAKPSWPPQPVNQVVYITRDQLESGIGEGREFSFQEALDNHQVLADGVYGYFNLISVGDQLLASSVNGTLDWIGLDGAVETFLPVSGSFLAFKPGEREFRAGLGPRGGAVYANVSDFSTFNAIVELSPDLFFRRGYINSDSETDIADVIALLEYLYLEGPEPYPGEAAGDLNDDGRVDISDPIYLLVYLFAGGQAPPEPFNVEGPDPTL